MIRVVPGFLVMYYTVLYFTYIRTGKEVMQPIDYEPIQQFGSRLI
jgi:hypothetical protein